MYLKPADFGFPGGETSADPLRRVRRLLPLFLVRQTVKRRRRDEQNFNHPRGSRPHLTDSDDFGG